MLCEPCFHPRDPPVVGGSALDELEVTSGRSLLGRIAALLHAPWVPWLLLAALLAIVGPGRVVAVCRHAHAAPIALAAALIVPNYGLRVLKWQRLLAAGGVRVSYGRALASLLGGSRLGYVTPARMGDAARVLHLPADDRVPALGMFALDRVSDMVAMVLIAVVAAGSALHRAGALLVLVGCAAGALAYARRDALLAVAEARLPPRVAVHCSNLRVALRGVTPRVLACAFLLALTYSSILIAQFFLMVRAFATDAPARIVQVLPAAMLSVSLPIGVGGLGVKEAATALLLAPYGVPAAAAVNGSLALFLLGVVTAFAATPWTGLAAPPGSESSPPCGRSPSRSPACGRR